MQAGYSTAFFLIPPSAKIEKPASSIWKHFYTARFSDEGSEGWGKHDLQLCVKRKYWFLSEADWTSPHMANIVSRKEFPAPPCPHFTICENKCIPNLLSICEDSKSRNTRFVVFFPYTNAHALWWAQVSFCWLLFNRAQTGSPELSSSSAAPFVSIF